jgi:hypothetical protein
MNPILTKFSYKDIRPKVSHGGDPRPELVLLTIGTDKRTQRMYLRISLHQRILADAGFIVGTRLTFEFDNGNMVLMEDLNGRRISCSNRNTKRGYVEFPMPPGVFTEMSGAGMRPEVTNGMIAFVMPKAGVAETATTKEESK